MKKVLVVFYSRSGTTSRVALEIAKELDADVDEILSVQERKGAAGYLRSGFEALTKGLPSIRTTRNPRSYELVVIGTPVWAGSISSPVRTYLYQHAKDFRSAACFCTMGGSGAESTLREMSALCGAGVHPTFHATTSDVRKDRHRRELVAFTTKLRQGAAKPFSHAA